MDKYTEAAITQIITDIAATGDEFSLLTATGSRHFDTNMPNSDYDYFCPPLSDRAFDFLIDCGFMCDTRSYQHATNTHVWKHRFLPIHIQECNAKTAFFDKQYVNAQLLDAPVVIRVALSLNKKVAKDFWDAMLVTAAQIRQRNATLAEPTPDTNP